MKKIFLSLLFVAGAFIGCQENADTPDEQQSKIDMSDFYLHTEENHSKSASKKGKECHSMQVLNRQLREDDNLYKKMYDVEYATRNFLAAKKGGKGGGGNGGGSGSGDVDVLPIEDGLGIVNIPVYVHVLYNNSNQNISSQQIQSQLDVMNDDFNTNNSAQLPSGTTFTNDATTAGIQFVLAGVTRKQSSVTDWGTNDAMKQSSQGGVDPVTPTTHLNIWVVSKMTSGGRTILGYAQFPGGSLSTDGVVIAHNYFGTNGSVTAPFNGGRTATHEVGHYLNLRHIWGDGRCRQDDFVADTPSSDGPNYGCPSYPTVNCKTTDMTMNYMDYTDDACMYMFTDGQRNRMRSLFASGGARASLAGN